MKKKLEIILFYYILINNLKLYANEIIYIIKMAF